MNQILIQQWLENYRHKPMKKRDALREILQQSALLGLARHNFFEHAAFYGGTALRILYGLDRFSEDLDFSLLKPNPEFDFGPFLVGLKQEMEALGFHVDVGTKRKEPPIFSAFLKTNTLELLIHIEDQSVTRTIHPEEKLSIKLEIDVTPPPEFKVEPKLVLNPTPFYVVSYVLSDIFAGKMHAILFRAWKGRVKGRDWYDLIWFVKNETPINLAYLTVRMQESGQLDKNIQLTRALLLNMLYEKIDKVDWEAAVNDIKAFIYDTDQLKLWSPAFFKELSSKIKVL